MRVEFEKRRDAIRRYLAGERPAQICRSLKRSERWLYKWLRRYEAEGGEGLRDLSRAPHHQARQTPVEVERAIVALRRRLADRRNPPTRYSLVGAVTIRAELERLGFEPVPALRTSEGILQRAGLTQQCRRFQTAPILRDYPGPPARDSNDVHQLDLVGPRYLRGRATKCYFPVLKDVFDQAGPLGVCCNRQAQSLVDFLVEVWQVLGVPKVLQIDNGGEFRGSRRWPRSLGKVIRFCLQAINREHLHEALHFQTTFQYRKGKALHRLPPDFDRHRRPMPLCAGKISFIRQVRRSGRITILNERSKVGRRVKGKFVKATILTKTQTLKVYCRGRLIKQWPYTLPK